MSAAPSPNDLYRACQRLVREGQPVFPCYSGLDGNTERAKRPMVKNGFKDASLDKDQIKRWWSRRGDSAIGIPTGIKYDVLDVDIKEGIDGRRHLPYLQRVGLLNGCKFVVRTPSGGWHLYFRANPDQTNKGRAATLGLDVRAKGGYVLAPPSYINDGENSIGAYENVGATVGGNDDPILWDLILASIEPVDAETKKAVPLLPSERRASVAALREWMSQRVSGERNNALHWAVCRCIESGIDPHEMVEPALLAGLGEEETLLTIESALKRAGINANSLMSEAEALFPD